MTQPRCSKCGSTDASRFSLERSEGRPPRWARWCRDCYAAYRRQRYAADAAFRQSRNAEHPRSPEAVTRRKATRRARSRGVDQDYAAILRADPCAYCGAPARSAVDHIVSDAPGDWTNLTAACRRCNGSKGDHALIAWLAVRGGDRPPSNPSPSR